MAQRCVDGEVAKFVCKWQGSVIIYHKITYLVSELFRVNGVCLSNQRVDIFLASVREAIVKYVGTQLEVREKQL